MYPLYVSQIHYRLYRLISIFNFKKISLLWEKRFEYKIDKKTLLLYSILPYKFINI